MCVCLNVYVFSRFLMYIYIYIYTYTYICMYANIHIYVHICIYVYIYIYVCLCVCFQYAVLGAPASPSLRSHLGHPIPPMQVSTDRRHTHADDELLTSSLHALCKKHRVANCETWLLQPGRNTRLDGAPQPAR